MVPIGISGSSSASSGLQAGDVDSGAPVFVIGGGKSNWLLIVGIAAAGALAWWLFFRRRR